MFVTLHKSYFYLLRAVKEMNSFLAGYLIEDIYTQEKDKLFFSIPQTGNINYHLIVSTNPQDYSLQIKDDHHKAKKNTIDFFSQFLPQRIISVWIAKGDRIVKIQLESGTIFIVFRGNNSNCFYENKDELISFKKIEKDKLAGIKAELRSFEWINDEGVILDSLKSDLRLEEIKSIQFIAKDIIRLAAIENEYSFEKIRKVLLNIISDQIAVGVDKNHSIAFFQPFSTLDQNVESELELFSDYFSAFDSLLIQKVKSTNEHILYRELEQAVTKELEKVTNRLNSLKLRIENGSRDTEYKRFGELLLSNMNSITKGMKEILVNDWDTDEEIKIKLDPKLSAKENIDSYFEKSRSEKIEYEKSKQLFNDAKNRFLVLNSNLEKLSQDLSIDELKELKKELRMDTIKLQPDEQKEKLPYRHFVIDGKYNFYIGKDSRNNDQLTTKFAKQNDFWFHARSVAGSHGVLRVENSKEAIPKKVLEKAASITAFYSKAKSSKLAPVTYTLKKYVSKNSRHEPGQVSVMKESVLLVKPEIPAGCEYQNDQN